MEQGQAQIYTIDAGHHNGDLQATAARLRETGNWKKQRVTQIIPTAKQLDSRVYTAHMGLVRPPNQPFYPLVITEAEVGAAYEAASRIILEHMPFKDSEFVLFIEHDNTPPSFGLIKLLSHLESHPELDAVSGLYFTKGYGGVAQIWGDAKDPAVNYRPQIPDPKGGLIPTYGIGQGFAVWRMEVFRKLAEKNVPRPWFKTVKDEGVGIGTQDLYFANLARTHVGAKMAVACDVPVGHIDVGTGKIW